MLTKKDYCDHETAWELCSLGYPEEGWCLLYSAQKWLREEKEINISPIYLFTDWGCIIKTPTYGDLIESHSSYEEALSEGIKEAIKILKENG